MKSVLVAIGLSLVSATALAQPAFDPLEGVAGSGAYVEPEPGDAVYGDIEEPEADLDDEIQPMVPLGPTLDEMDRALSEVQKKRDLAFCHDERYPVTSRDRGSCALAKPAKDRCPAFAAACQQPLTGGSRGSPEPEPAFSAPESRPPSALSGLASVVFWVLIAAGVIGLVSVIVKSLRLSSAPEPSSEPSRDELAPPPPPGETAPRKVETDVDRLLARARNAAARGAFTEAMADAYAAALRHLDLSGVVELHPSKTNGDYIRSLREHPDIQRKLRTVAREVDRAHFGGLSPTREAFERVLSTVLPLVGRAMLLVLAVGLAFGTSGCDRLQRGRDDGHTATAWGTSPSGYSVLVDLIEHDGALVKRRLDEVDEIAPMTSAVIVIDTDLKPEEWRVLGRWVEHGGVLIVAGDSESERDEIPGTLESGPCLGSLRVDETSPLVTRHGLGDAKVFGAAGRGFSREPGIGESVIRCGDQPFLHMRAYRQGELVTLADASFLSNASLLAGDNARVVMSFLGREPVVEVIDRFTGSGARTPLQTIANAHLTPFVLQMLVLMLLLGAWRGAHFGTPRDRRDRSRRSFSEHVRALGSAYASANASRTALANYAGWALDRLRERALPGGGKLSDLAQAIARRTGRAEGDVMRWLVEARTARDEGPMSRPEWAPASQREPLSRRALGKSEPTTNDLEVMRALGVLLVQIGGKKR